MTPLVFGLGVWELLIILAVLLLIFGGTRLAGLGKSTGRALREFKEETKDLRDAKEAQASGPASTPVIGPESGMPGAGNTYSQPPQANLPNSGAQDPSAGEPRRDS
jgi:sec-independent protein translocase protein TatA